MGGDTFAAKATAGARTGYEKAWDEVVGGWEWAAGQVRVGVDEAWRRAEEVVAGRRHKEL
jgi:hypothetical protein